MMNKEVESYLNKFDPDIQDLFAKLQKLVQKSIAVKTEESLWAKLPSFYVGKNFVRLIPFKDHINIEADAIINYQHQLPDYRITPKGMLQIYLNQAIPEQCLQKIFYETLTK